MKILREELLIDPSEVSSFNKLGDNEERLDFVEEKLKEVLKSTYKYVDTSNKDTNLLSELKLTTIEKGWNTDTNKELDIANNLKEELPIAGFRLAAQLLEQSRTQARDSDNSWMLEANSYKPVFKAKAIGFLKSPKAKAFGENPQQALNDILPMDDEESIKSYLRNWQTKSGDTKDVSNPTVLQNLLRLSDIDSLKGKSLPSDLQTQIKKLGAEDEPSKELVISIVNHLFGDDYKSLMDRLAVLEESLSDGALRRALDSLKDVLTSSSSDPTKAYKKLRNFLDDLKERDEKNKPSTDSTPQENPSKDSNSSNGRIPGRDLLKKQLGLKRIGKDSDITLESELKKIIKKSSNYANLSSTSAVDDYLDDKSNLTKVLNNKYHSYNELLSTTWSKATRSGIE